MKTILLSITALALSACGLTPKQLQALDGVMCNAWTGYGATLTTVIVGGASRPTGVQTTPACAVSIVNEVKP
jgi:hypothetical protein